MFRFIHNDISDCLQNLFVMNQDQTRNYREPHITAIINVLHTVSPI